MRKYAFLIGACCLFAGRLCADPVNFTITSLTATNEIGHNGYVVFSGTGSSASGDSISIYGDTGDIFHSEPVFPGDPIQSDASFDLIFAGPMHVLSADAKIGGKDYGLLLEGDGQVSANTNLTLDPSTLTYIVPATVTGEFTVVCYESPNCADGTLIGNVFLNLSGDVTFKVDYVSAEDEYFIFDNSAFVSTPEPSSLALLLVAGVLAGGRLRWRGSLS